MIIIEISDESISFLIFLIGFSVVIGSLIVEWTLRRDARKRLEKGKETEK